jgi:hypothetical protein
MVIHPKRLVFAENLVPFAICHPERDLVPHSQIFHPEQRKPIRFANWFPESKDMLSASV